tara:strand:- start:424 stop:585 length:162 start_codon:yes stop_codon:yes gene_type:complete
MDSLKVTSISFANYGVYLAEINLLLQCVVAIMSIIYLGIKIKGKTHEKNLEEV